MFEDALKKYFYGTGTDAGTATSRVPLLDANGNPIGSVTLEKFMDLLMEASESE